MEAAIDGLDCVMYSRERSTRCYINGLVTAEVFQSPEKESNLPSY